MSKTLYIVIPCYNEQAVLPITSKQFLAELEFLIDNRKISDDSRIMFVNDGSKDDTWKIIKELAESNPHFIGISQSRNRGHQAAVLAGLMEAKKFADFTISIDCDGQDDISAMERMVDAYNDGCDVVYGVRSKRDTDTAFKRMTAEGFYKVLKVMGVDCVFNHADYRLISKRVLDEFENYKEVNLFLRGMVPLVGFKSTNVFYERHERIAGESHYPLKKMIALAVDGITSLSIKPLEMIAVGGFGLFCFALLGLIISAVTMSSTGIIVWSVFTATGLLMSCIGVVGEYVGKAYMETKHRPRYIISERTFDE